jgi:hypothetical protein
VLVRTISLWTRHCARECNKKVNHEMPVERIPSSLAPKIRRALRLCRKLDSPARQEQAQNGDKIDAAKRAKTTTLSIAYMLAGAPGLEPGNGGIKNRPNNLI